MLQELTADIALLNGKIITIDEQFCIAQALAIKDGKFLAVGRDTDIKPLIDKHTEVFDLKGKTVLPGFIDSHIHMTWTGVNLKKIDLRGFRSISQLLEAVQERVKEAPRNKWIQGFGWDEGYFDDRRYPTRWDLDSVSPDHPVHLARATDISRFSIVEPYKLPGSPKTLPSPQED